MKYTTNEYGKLKHVHICICTHLYLESQDNSPNKAKCQPVIPIHNIMRSHVFQVHSLLFQELEGFINILQAMDTHPSLSWFRLEGKREKKNTYYCR